MITTQYQVLLVIESVDLDENGETIPDSRDEERCEIVILKDSLESANDALEAMLETKDLIEKVYKWLS